MYFMTINSSLITKPQNKIEFQFSFVKNEL
jgi:hypothetical protein